MQAFPRNLVGDKHLAVGKVGDIGSSILRSMPPDAHSPNPLAKWLRGTSVMRNAPERLIIDRPVKVIFRCCADHLESGRWMSRGLEPGCSKSNAGLVGSAKLSGYLKRKSASALEGLSICR